MVEEQFGYEVADKIVTNSDLPSGGVYTALGKYDHQEMVQLLTSLQAETHTTIPSLLKAFGKYLFKSFGKSYGAFFEEAEDAFSFLKGIENHIHVEVLKLYPDAELPKFEISQLNSNQLELVYRSERGLADLAEGLIRGCIEHYSRETEVLREDINGPFVSKFTLTQM